MDFLEKEWKELLNEELTKPYISELKGFLEQEYKERQIFPPENEIFTAFHKTLPADVKVVILGQDPYHDENQAHGLSFSVKPGVAIPKSLQNIYKELQTEFGYEIPNHGYLEHWAEQGVFLLNTVLTVRAHEANSHKGRGWEDFTDAVIRVLNTCEQPMVFLLWGKPAEKKEKILDNPNHLVLKAAHPSPLSAYRGFFGCEHFRLANAFLEEHGRDEIDWRIESIKSL